MSKLDEFEPSSIDEEIELDSEEQSLKSALDVIQVSSNMSEDPTSTEFEKKLGPKRMKFVNKFMSNGGDYEVAAKEAGYPVAHGARLLNDKIVKRVILDRLQARGFVQNLTPDWVLSKWAIMHDKCSKEIDELDRRGNKIGTKLVDASNANRALENIARHLGMFKDTMEIGGTDTPIVQKQDVKINIESLAAGIARRVIENNKEN